MAVNDITLYLKLVETILYIQFDPVYARYFQITVNADSNQYYSG